MYIRTNSYAHRMERIYTVSLKIKLIIALIASIFAITACTANKKIEIIHDDKKTSVEETFEIEKPDLL